MTAQFLAMIVLNATEFWAVFAYVLQFQTVF